MRLVRYQYIRLFLYVLIQPASYKLISVHKFPQPNIFHLCFIEHPPDKVFLLVHKRNKIFFVSPHSLPGWKNSDTLINKHQPFFSTMYFLQAIDIDQNDIKLSFKLVEAFSQNILIIYFKKRFIFRVSSKLCYEFFGIKLSLNDVRVKKLAVPYLLNLWRFIQCILSAN